MKIPKDKATIFTLCIMFFSTAFSQFKFNDTLFFLRDVRRGYDAMYLIKDSNSAFYNDFLNFYAGWKHTSAKPNVKRKGINVTSNQLLPQSYGWLKGEWYTVNLFEGRLYLYLPSERAYLNCIKILDSTFSDWRFGESCIYRFQNFKAEGNASISMELVSDQNSKRKIIFRKLNNYPGLVIGKFIDNDGEEQNMLLVSKKDARQYPIIVHYSPDQKAFYEFAFDELNFENMK
jgi:hypothetical protein